MVYIDLDMGGGFSAYDQETVLGESLEWAVCYVGVWVTAEVLRLAGSSNGLPEVRFTGTYDEIAAIAHAYYVEAGETEEFALEQIML